MADDLNRSTPPQAEETRLVPVEVAARQAMGLYYELDGQPGMAEAVRADDWSAGTSDNERLLLRTFETVIETARKEVLALSTPSSLPIAAIWPQLTDEFRAMSPLDKWETLVLHGLIGEREPWIEDMWKALRDQEARLAARSPIAAEGSVLESLIFACDSAFKDYEGQSLSGDWLVAVLKPAIERARKGVNVPSRAIEPVRYALRIAAERFRTYEQLHAAKGTPEGDDKAVSNGDMAALCEGALPASPIPPDHVLDRYSACILADGGGGNIEWWQDYLRAELERAHEFYQGQVDGLSAAPQPPSPGLGLPPLKPVDLGLRDNIPIVPLSPSPPPSDLSFEDKLGRDAVFEESCFKRAEELIRARRAPPASGEAEAVARALELAAKIAEDTPSGSTDPRIAGNCRAHGRAIARGIRTLSPKADGGDHG